MATTTSKKKTSWMSLLNLILSVLPLVLDYLNAPSQEDVYLVISKDDKKLRAFVRSGEESKSVKKSVTNK